MRSVTYLSIHSIHPKLNALPGHLNSKTRFALLPRHDGISCERAPDGQITDWAVQSHVRKYSASYSPQIKSISLPIPSHLEGRCARHGRWGGMRWTRAVLLTRAWRPRTAKSCGPDAPTLASSSDNACALCLRWWQTSPVTKESAKETVKTIAQGRPDDSGEPVVSNSCAFYFCTRGCGCIGHPAFPAPSLCFEGQG